MSNAFLSYARSDGRDEADLLERQLKAARRNVWVDRYSLRGGDEWGPEIKEAIRKAEAFILLLTPESVQSSEVQKEYSEALRLKKHFLPLLIKPCQPPPGIEALNYLDLTGADQLAFARLLGDLDRGWEKVEEAFAKLELLGLSGDFDFLLDKLRRLSEQRGKLELPPELYLAWADLVTRMSRDVTAAHPLRALVDQSLDDRYLDDRWEWRSVFQAHDQFFLKQLRDWQTRLPRPAADVPVGEPVPIVLLVMTHQEALDLQSGAALAHESDELKALVTELKRRLDADPSTSGWVDRYSAAAQDWKPYGDSRDTLAELVSQELRRVGQDLEPPKPFIPKFITIREIDGLANRVKLRDLRTNGCVLIMDVLSICHPELHAAYRRSLLDAYSGTFLVKIGPPVPLPSFQQELTFRVNQRLDLEFSYRQELDRDPKCRRFMDLVDLRNYIYNESWLVTPKEAWPKNGPRPYWLR